MFRTHTRQKRGGEIGRRKAVQGLLAALLCLTAGLCGCSRAALLSTQISEENQIMNEAVDTFFAALDARDAETIKGLFSVSALEEDEDMDGQLAKLMEAYPGPTDFIRRETASGSRSYSHGSHVFSTYSSFPVLSNNTYYWCSFSIMFENDEDEDQIGVTAIKFYTADEYCGVMDELWDAPMGKGLHVSAERTLEKEVRCIENMLFQYTPMEPLDRAEVEAFLEGLDHCSYADFTARFGEPSKDRNWSYYELLPEDGSPQYMRVMFNERDEVIQSVQPGDISSISVVSDFYWQEYLWQDVERRGKSPFDE